MNRSRVSSPVRGPYCVQAADESDCPGGVVAATASRMILAICSTVVSYTVSVFVEPFLRLPRGKIVTCTPPRLGRICGIQVTMRSTHKKSTKYLDIFVIHVAGMIYDCKGATHDRNK